MKEENKKYLDKLIQISLGILDKYKPSKTPDLTEYQQRVLKTIDRGQFGCQTERVVEFANAFCGFNFHPFIDIKDERFEHGTVLKMLSKVGSYKANSLVCVFYSGHAYSVDDRDHHGSDLRTNQLDKEVRLANKEEIEKFYRKVQDQDYFFNLMNYHSRIKR